VNLGRGRLTVGSYSFLSLASSFFSFFFLFSFHYFCTEGCEIFYCSLYSVPSQYHPPYSDLLYFYFPFRTLEPGGSRYKEHPPISVLPCPVFRFFSSSNTLEPNSLLLLSPLFLLSVVVFIRQLIIILLPPSIFLSHLVFPFFALFLVFYYFLSFPI